MPQLVPGSKQDSIVQALKKAYSMELETVMNYLACSVELDGVRAEAIKKALQADVLGEIGHATQLANRIKQLGGHVPGSLQLELDQKSMQPPADTTDVMAVIKGVLDAENAAIDHYKKVARLCDGEDYVTQDLAITILADEEEHRQTFEGYLKEYQKC